MSKEAFEGSCLCGNVKITLIGKPVWVGYCHCESCRRATGAAVVTHVGAHPSKLIYTSATPRVFESSPGVRRRFCADCGSPISYDSDRYDAYVQVYLGLFNEPEKLLPRSHVNCVERISWFDTNDTLPRFDGTGDDGTESWKDE